MPDEAMPAEAPTPPPLTPDMLRALMEWAAAEAEYHQGEVEEARRRGLDIHPQELANVEGWKFVSLALDEAYDGYWD